MENTLILIVSIEFSEIIEGKGKKYCHFSKGFRKKAIYKVLLVDAFHRSLSK